jgi:hypothetical protein
MRRDARRSPSSPVRRNHINPVPRVIEDRVEERRRTVRQDRSGTTSEYGSHQAPLPTQHGIAEGVNALMDPMEPADRLPFPSDLLSKAEVVQLPTSHNPVLLLG